MTTDLLTGRVALVTGAARGQGRGVALRFAREGACLVLGDLREDELEETRRLVEKEGAEAVAIPTDLSDVDRINALVDAAIEQFGALDVLYNNAGVIWGGPVETATVEDFDRVMAVNARSQLFAVARALPALKASEHASVINVSSIGGYVGAPMSSIYSASKAASIGVSRSLAVELAPYDIRVNAIVPGAIDTAMPQGFLANFEGAELEAMKERLVSRQLMKRFATVDEIGNVAVFLASDESSFLTGLTLPVDGGYTAW
jgi:NAD(P)-dependent dehydrogenase (short-subunit alcohol dehydrogenase family)